MKIKTKPLTGSGGKPRGEKTMKFHEGQIINYNGHQCKVIDTWYDDYEEQEGITITPTGNYGFPVDLYTDRLKRYWVGVEDKNDYMARYGADTYAYSMEKAQESFEREYGDHYTLTPVIEITERRD